jgi:hypothetical protein
MYERHAHADLEHAGRFAAIRGDARNRSLQFIEIVLERMEEAFAGLCESELPSAALKQADAQITFQRRDIAAHRGRRQGEPPGGG